MTAAPACGAAGVRRGGSRGSRGSRGVQRFGGIVALALVPFGAGLLAPAPARAQAVADPIETEERREAALAEAFTARTAAIVDATCRVQTSRGDDLGYGVAIEAGWVVTALDALADLGDGARLQVRARGGTAPAEVVARNEGFAVALLKVQAGREAVLTPAPRGDASALRVGRFVMAVGTDRRPLSAGVISALDRRVEASPMPTALDPFGIVTETLGPQRDFARVIQHDGTLTRDMLGAALCDSQGRLVGLNVASIYRGTAYAVGLGDLLHILPDMKAGRSGPQGPPTGYLGIAIRPVEPDRREALGIDGLGAVIVEVVPGQPAEAAGLALGDVLRSVDGHAIYHPEALGAALRGKPPGTEVTMVVHRDGKDVALTVVLGERPPE